MCWPRRSKPDCPPIRTGLGTAYTARMPAQLDDHPARLLTLLAQPPAPGRRLVALTGLARSDKQTAAADWAPQVNLRAVANAARAVPIHPA